MRSHFTTCPSSISTALTASNALCYSYKALLLKMQMQQLKGPYGDVDEPYMHSRRRSIWENPVVVEFESFITYVDQKIQEVNQIDAQSFFMGPTTYYRYRPWFSKMMREYERNANLTRDEQHRALSALHFSQRERNGLLVLQASLEITCSLMIFCQDKRYESLNDKEIEKLRFPLSKPSRNVVFSCQIHGDRIGFNSYLLDGLM